MGPFEASRDVGSRLAGSYVNFSLVNGMGLCIDSFYDLTDCGTPALPGGVVVPGFGDPEYDRRAVEALQAVFPDRRVVQVRRGREILLGGGNVHCITLQQPAA